MRRKYGTRELLEIHGQWFFSCKKRLLTVWFVLKKEHLLPLYLLPYNMSSRRTCFSFHGDFIIWD